MKRKPFWIGAVMALAVGAASLVALANPNQNLEIERPPRTPPACTCPHVYDPVVCKAADGSVASFSNACFAGCAGYSQCASISPAPGQ